jgi:Nif-specific regulatory protein
LKEEMMGNADFKPAPEGGPEFILPHDRLMTLFVFSKRISQITDLAKLLDEVLRSAISGIGAERGLIILTDETGSGYQTVASELLQDEDISFSTSIVQTTLEKKKTLMSSDLSADSRFKNAESIAGLNILSFICVPLIVPGQDQPLGTLYVDQRIYVKTFTKEDAAFLEAFANLAAISISHANVMDRLARENVQLRGEVEKRYEFPGVIGQSKIMQDVFHTIQRILNDDCTVLITGESGTGKEVLARAIHYNGNRAKKPFLAINCGALPETLLEAELFGSVRGAFTGAVDKQGLFQATQGGTLFLDEIQHTSEAMQIKLLRVLQDKEIRRVGGTSSLKVDIRLICATNEDLKRAVQLGNFRQDFFYRINVVTIDVPPLRQRREDIPLLADHFLKTFSEEKGKQIRGFDKSSLQALVNYDWVENNTRELENEIERAVIFAREGSTIGIRDLSEKLQGRAPVGTGAPDLFTDDRGQPLDYHGFEKKYISFVLSQANGNKARAAAIMGIHRSTLRGKMRRLRMES